MTRFMTAVLTIGVFIFTSSLSLAVSADSDTLASYEQGAKVSVMGMCDNNRSTFVLFLGSDFAMEMFAPVADSSVRFYVVTKKDDKEYFIKRFKEGGSVEVRKLSPMDWSAELMPLSMSYFRAHFLPESDHDCFIAPPLK